MTRRSSRSYLLPHVLRRFFRKRETVAYPYGPLEIADAYRGQVFVDIERCVGCGRCATDCPSNGLAVERLDDGGVRVVLYHDRCGSCGLCESACPRGAIELIPRYVAPATCRTALCSEWRREGKPH